MNWLIIDVSYLCYRNFNVLGELSYEGIKTGVIFGFLRDIRIYQEDFNADRVVFCFDRKPYLRSKVYEGYKNRAQEYDEEELAARLELRRQIKKLHKLYLPRIGFKNVLSQKGYEADDLIAATCEAIKKPDKVTIISADQDLWQLLTDRVSIYNPASKSRSYITKESFEEKWGLDPFLWSDVKAIAGCNSDTITGVPGVGEKTAAEYLAGRLPAHYKAFEKIAKATQLKLDNLKLVRLPYPGTKIPPLRADEVTAAKWKYVTKKLGIRSLRGL